MGLEAATTRRPKADREKFGECPSPIRDVQRVESDGTYRSLCFAKALPAGPTRT